MIFWRLSGLKVFSNGWIEILEIGDQRFCSFLGQFLLRTAQVRIVFRWDCGGFGRFQVELVFISTRWERVGGVFIQNLVVLRGYYEVVFVGVFQQFFQCFLQFFCKGVIFLLRVESLGIKVEIGKRGLVYSGCFSWAVVLMWSSFWKIF